MGLIETLFYLLPRLLVSDGLTQHGDKACLLGLHFIQQFCFVRELYSHSVHLCDDLLVEHSREVVFVDHCKPHLIGEAGEELS